MIFYSASTRSFYRREVHGTAIPADAVEVLEEKYAELIRAQASGQEIVPGPLGPVAQTPAPEAVTVASARRKRDALLTASDWTQLPDAPLTAEQRAAWGVYRAALRHLPLHPSFPDVAFPAAPG